MMTWMKENGCQWDPKTMLHDAAENRQLKALWKMREMGCAWDPKTCESAVVSGDLKVLQWLRKHGCPWDEFTCTTAAELCELEMLKWAIENGCPCEGLSSILSQTSKKIQKWVKNEGLRPQEDKEGV